MKKIMQRFFGVLTSVALLVTSATPVFASSGSSTHNHDGGYVITTKTDPPYTITLSYPPVEGGSTSDYEFKEGTSCFGAYQIFSGEVKGENYTEAAGKENPGNTNESIPITDIKWGNAFGIVDSEDPHGIEKEARERNILGFVHALATASTGDYGYAFKDFTEFIDFFSGGTDKLTLSSDYTIGSGTITVVLDKGKVTKINATDGAEVNFDKLAVAVADKIAEKTDHEWLQEFTDILGGFAQNPDSVVGGYLNPSYVDRFYEGSIDTDHTKYKIKVPAGYYMIRDLSTIDESAGADQSHAFSARMLFVANNVDQELKVDVPTLDKNVLRDSDPIPHETEAAGVGDIVHYQLKGTLPSNYDLYVGGYQYTFIDTLSKGLDLVKYNEGTTNPTGTNEYVNVKVKGLFRWNSDDKTWVWEAGTEASIPQLFKSYDTAGVPDKHHHLSESPTEDGQSKNNYDVTYESNKLTVKFTCLSEIRIEKEGSYYRLGYNNATDGNSSEIYVDYYAKVNQNAVVSPAQGANNRNGNQNQAQIKYSDNPQAYGDTDYTTIDNATVYVFGLDIVKIDAAEYLRTGTAGGTAALDGAKFALVRPKTGTSDTNTEWEIASFTFIDSATAKAMDPAPTVKSFLDYGYYTIESWETIVSGSSAVKGEKFNDAWLSGYTAPKHNIATKDGGHLNISGLDVGVTYTMVETETPEHDAAGNPVSYAKIDPFTFTLTAAKEGTEYNGELESATIGSDHESKEGSFSYENFVRLIDPTTSTSDNNGSASMLVANFKYIDLPSTGGVGTYLFYIIGGGIIVLSAVLFILSKKKTTK